MQTVQQQQRVRDAACRGSRQAAGRLQHAMAAPRRSTHTPVLSQGTPAAVIPRSRRALVVQAVAEAPVSASAPQTYTSLEQKTTRPRLVVLGSGWAAMSFIKALPANIKEQYELVLVSPRNYFLYTPLLPAVATGTMEERSIVEPVRNLVIGKGEYYEAVCTDIYPDRKELICCFPKDAGFAEACFKVPYDVLVMGVGSVNNTFGIKGVAEYCNFFKSIEDASRLRARISECFERAALPATYEEERKKLLSFVVVGGGPTGVEVAAEMYDMMYDDLSRLYPDLIKDVQIRVVELMDHVLSTYDRAISIYTADQFKRAGVQLVLNSRVASVQDGLVQVVNKSGETTDIPFGACVWATGIAMNPLIKQLQEKVPGQKHFRSILTDDFLRVKGTDGSIYAVGDACTIDQPKALDYAEELFSKANKDSDNRVSLADLRHILEDASKRFVHLEEHARFLETRSGAGRWGSFLLMGKNSAAESGPLSGITEDTKLNKDEFHELLGKIDSGLRALPATAQVAKQQGEYVAGLFARNTITGKPETTKMEGAQPFNYSHKGSAAYIGSDQAVFDAPALGVLTGWGAGLLWKGFETYSQISFRNQCLVFTDWLRTKLFGRDISRV